VFNTHKIFHKVHLKSNLKSSAFLNYKKLEEKKLFKKCDAS
jgi:hypothetical protein